MKNKLFKKIYAFLGVLVMLLPLALGSFGTGVKAAEGDSEQPAKQNIVLTKFGFSKNLVPDIANDGAQIKDPLASTRLAGVEFQIYDVTEQYWASEDKANFATTLTEETRTNGILVDTPNSTTDANGEIKASLNVTSGKKNAVYLFHEVAGETNKDFKLSPDFVVGFPVVVSNKQLDPVYIYAKNENVNDYHLKFQKIDANSKVPLKGAEFIIARGKDDERLYAKKTLYGVQWFANKEEATTFTSDDNGIFELSAQMEKKVGSLLTGLDPKAEYYAIETKAPDGYEEITKENASKFEFGLFNAVKADEKTNEIAMNEITNTAKGQLPHTGGMGIVLFVVAGAALLAIGAFAYKKQRA